MKFHETHFEEYISAVNRYNIHPELTSVIKKPEFSQLGNLIFYGPSGVGKYSQVLWFLKTYSPSELKYDKRITMQNEKYTYTYRISDIHYEIDMSLLGCNSKMIWHEIFQQIVDIISMKPVKTGIIVCKNFHAIHNELLENFYSYMQQYNHPHLIIQVKFILMMEHISFLPNSILDNCRAICVKRPMREAYDKVSKSNRHPLDFCEIGEHVITVNPSPKFSEEIDTRDILNLKEVYMCNLLKKDANPPKEIFNIICDTIIQDMTNPKKMVIAEFRDSVYDILIYNLDVADCLWYILDHFIQLGALTETSISKILDKTHNFLKYYNNNYRPIYHLENIFFFIINRIHKFDEP